MRFCAVREADGTAERCSCDLCGDTVYRGEDYYRINGQSFAPIVWRTLPGRILRPTYRPTRRSEP